MMSLKMINQIMFRTGLRYQPDFAIRFYGRWMHRKPAKVILPFEPNAKTNLKSEKVIDLAPEITKKSLKLNQNEKKAVQITDEKLQGKESSNISERNQIVKKREDKLKKRMFYLSQLKVFDDNNEVIYEKLKENDGKISTLLTKLKSKKERQLSNQVLVEGWRLIVDGLEAKCKLKYVIFSSVEDLNHLRPFLPKTGVKLYKIPYREIQLWSDVETSPGIFGIFEKPQEENIKKLSAPLPLQLICDNIRVPGNLGAILRVAVGVGCEKVLLTKGCVDVWEPKVLRSAAGAHFRLPIINAIDWEDMPKHLQENTSVFVADSNAVIDEETAKTNEIEGMKLPLVPYYGVEYSTLSHITLIVGGETEGISVNSYRLAVSKNGLRLNIPLQRGVDSLNTGMAAAVVAFEIRKQLTQYWTKLKLQRMGESV